MTTPTRDLRAEIATAAEAFAKQRYGSVVQWDELADHLVTTLGLDTWPANTDDLLALIRRGIADPGSVLPRNRPDNGSNWHEPIPAWGARAVLHLLTANGWPGTYQPDNPQDQVIAKIKQQRAVTTEEVVVAGLFVNGLQEVMFR